MRKYAAKPQIRVTGQMNQRDSGIFGQQQARNERLLAIGTVLSRALLGMAALIYAVRWW